MKFIILPPLSLILMCFFAFTTTRCSDENPSALPDSIVAIDSALVIPGWTLVWNDEFNGTSIDVKKWHYEVNGDGGGNNEKQYYTDRVENSYVDTGTLIIVAREESYFGQKYTSARIRSKYLGDWTYGRFEIRAMLPWGVGTWPAIWMLPTDKEYGDWPSSGEIDIMEHVGYDPNVIHGSTHSKKYYFVNGTQKSGTVRIQHASYTFHTYAIEWYADSINFFVDGSKYFTSRNERSGWEAWPFDKRFHFILNIAVGGNWGGLKGIDNTIFPQKMVIDYVRVYKKKP
ncbi:MAG: glycoside hydrolase family 16 protein [Bacteriovoracaceae bacterium]|nr:glycoside hydrolase family 16 protein [Bacteroidota bacterium]